MKTRVIIAEILGVVSPSKNDTRSGFVIKYPQMEAGDSGVRRFSENVLERIAENCGFPDFESLADMLKACLDKGEFECTQEHRIKGDSWENEETGEKGAFKETHWAIVGIPKVHLSDELAEELKTVNRELLKEKLKNKPKRRAASASTSKAVKSVEEIFDSLATTVSQNLPKDADVDTDEDDDDDDDLFETPPVEEKKKKK